MANQYTTLRDLAERFWAKVRVGGLDECWLWQEHRDPQGYGKFDGSSAQRTAWRLVRGLIPPETPCVLHRCDNPPCCNPLHLFVGTHADNCADKIAKGRFKPGRGERHRSAKVTEAQVRQLRDTYYAGGVSYKTLGHLYGMSGVAARKIVLRISWPAVD